jgi:hypothetical protein
LHGAGLGDIVIPRKKFVKEHRHLVELLNRYDIPALRKEAADQAEELKLKGGFFNLNAFRGMPSGTKAILSSAVKPVMESLIPALGQVAETLIPLIGKGTHRENKGGNKQSGFIRRLMAENTVRHQGQYRNPTDLVPNSTMFHKARFDWKQLANPSQSGVNTHKGNNPDNYGASPFILKHFAQAEPVPYVRKRGEQPPLQPFPNRKRSSTLTQESELRRKPGRVSLSHHPQRMMRSTMRSFILLLLPPKIGNKPLAKSG